MNEVQLVDTTTGEAQASSYAKLSRQEMIEILERKERELNGYRLNLGRLERELAQVEEKRPEAKDIRTVLEYHHSLYMEKARIIPGSRRWRAVKNALKHFEVTELKATSDGARKSRWHMDRQHRLKAENLFSNLEAVEELRDLGLGIVHRTLRNGLTLSPEAEVKLAEIKVWEFDALDRCDCGHLRFQHKMTCAHCGCLHFDDIHQRAEAWTKQQMKKAS